MLRFFCCSCCFFTVTSIWGNWHLYNIGSCSPRKWYVFPLFKISFYVIYWLLSWRRGPLPTPVFWPGKSQGLYSRAFCIGFIHFLCFLFWFACFDSIVNGVVFLILNCLLLSSVTNNQAPSARDVFSFPGLGWLPREGNGNPLQYPSWEIPWTEDPAGLQSLGSQKSWIWWSY